MTAGARPTLVGAVFPDRLTAAAAASELRRQGLADRDLVSAVWSADRYVIESDVGRRMKRGWSTGALIGAAAGAVLMAGLGVLVFPALDTGAAVLIGGTAGLALGVFWGAYLGLNRFRPLLWDEQDWSHVAVDEGEVLLVVAVGDDAAVAEATLLDRGGRKVEAAGAD
ncbi:MAG: hypothetical protein R6X29_11930 [Acidimicrobiia bacterium]|jgi:hypothetical protein